MYSGLRLTLLASSVAVIVGCTPTESHTASEMSSSAPEAPVTLYIAKDLITMSEQTPVGANAIAVQDGKILDVGLQAELETRYSDSHGFQINQQFADKVLTPGFVEPHIHMWLSAILMGTEFITPADWFFPDGAAKGVQSEEAYFTRLKEVEAGFDVGKPLVTWGYHQYFHGQNMSRATLDEISSQRPIIVWHRSFHELYFNTAAIEMFGWTEQDWSGDGYAYQQMDWDKGHVYENGAKTLLQDVLGFLMKEGMFATGLERTKQYVHSGGITTAIDPGVVIDNATYEQMVNILTDGAMPMEYWLIPAGNFTYSMAGYDAEKGKQIAEAQTVQQQGHGNIQWLPKFVKLFSDGAMYSQLMQLKDGYLDGHEGEWLQTPEQLEDSMRPYWQDDYTIMVHANGDLGFEAAVDIVDKLAKEKPRTDHRTGFHHLGITDKDDIPRAVKQGSNFSVNPYYTHILAENYAQNGVGEERASEMSRGRSFIDKGGILSLHSDAPMAPAQPLALVWAAVNRIGLSGTTVMGASERISVEEALQGVTINAAYTARLEDRIGSIDVGKDANFAVLEKSPYEVDPRTIKDLKIEATIFEGHVYPIEQSNLGMQMTFNTQRSMAVAGFIDTHDHDVCESSLLMQSLMHGRLLN